MAQFAREDLNANTAVILRKADSEFSMGLSDYFKQAFLEHGTILWEGKYLGNDTDFSSILQKVKELTPDVVFVPGHGRDSALILKQANAMGIQATFLGGDGWGKGMLNIAGAETVEGHYFSGHWHPDIETPLAQEFMERYQHKYGETRVATSAALAYDATLLLADAITRAQSLNQQKIRDALAATNNFHGVTGPITFDEHGDPVKKQGVILKYHQGEIVFVKTITP
jgi:branched-chain amino acid transport system substrate-binding protein